MFHVEFYKLKKSKQDLLEKLCDKVATAIGPRPREGVVIQHPRHDVVDTAGRLDELLTLEIVVVRHVQSITTMVFFEKKGQHH